ncbi:class I SAM-dependent rRNA methyltransferase [Xylanibacillus composti]|uniref:SAM-dependent methyltransferase n=1 Tax=Xylanibacillus composti TaxID=1572762 RepID=A0A8J4H4V7_9BACL|nr:class I SAM-dependent rRNA methyltransferase [Xylanibacillus composti]MDT9724438.1 class I SAM-dependent rRNA methyltransferase [Xylanibacillus composti]GIQ69700.1 SAM-dependent methyltransferase [Xylanibacillus composti]
MTTNKETLQHRAALVLSAKRKKRLEAGHPWIFENEAERLDGSAEPGDLVDVLDHRGKFLATGAYNPHSRIRARVVSFQRLVEMDAAFFTERLAACKRYRQRFLGQAGAYRAVYGEADGLPGLIVDKYGDVLVAQFLTYAMDKRKAQVTEALAAVFQPRTIYERSDVGVRELEGLPETKGLLYGEAVRYVQMEENGLKLQVDIEEGQKTGYFFDQRENRAAIAPLMKGWGWRSGIEHKEAELDGGMQVVPVNKNGKPVTFPYWDGATVLECFSHTGSFTLHACHYGAKKVTCLDISEHAIESARRNVELNGFQDRVEFVVADAFQYLREQVAGLAARQARGGLEHVPAGKRPDTSRALETGGRTWDVVILDPPAFAKNRAAVAGACRGYKDINLHALKLVNEGGFLVTASCSYHVRPDLFLETIRQAAQDAGKRLRLVEFRGAGKDHPQILGVDEGHYLKFAIFEVTAL